MKCEHPECEKRARWQHVVYLHRTCDEHKRWGGPPRTIKAEDWNELVRQAGKVCDA